MEVSRGLLSAWGRGWEREEVQGWAAEVGLDGVHSHRGVLGRHGHELARACRGDFWLGQEYWRVQSIEACSFDKVHGSEREEEKDGMVRSCEWHGIAMITMS